MSDKAATLLVERLLNETQVPPATPPKLGRNVIAIDPRGDEIMAVDADEQVLNQLRQEGFGVDEFDVTFGVLPRSQARYDALVDSGRTFRLVTPSGLVVKTVDFM